MAPIIWNEMNTTKLIELYKSYDFLWNRSLPLYRDIYARQHAYLEIVKKLNMPISEIDVKKKIKNLRTSYYEMQKKNQTSLSKSRRPWIQALCSLMEQASQRKETEDVAVSSEDEADLDECMVSEVDEEPETFVVSIKEEFFDEMRAQDNAAVADYLEPVEKKPKIVLVDDEGPDDAPPMATSKVMAGATELPENVVARSRKLDEFQLFANSIAAQLRSLPLDRALSLEVDIQTLVVKERLRFHKVQKDDSTAK